MRIAVPMEQALALAVDHTGEDVGVLGVEILEKSNHLFFCTGTGGSKSWSALDLTSCMTKITGRLGVFTPYCLVKHRLNIYPSYDGR